MLNRLSKISHWVDILVSVINIFNSYAVLINVFCDPCSIIEITSRNNCEAL